jgi:hypothetical protein
MMERQLTEPALLSFQWNVYAQACAALLDDLDHEVPPCQSRGATVRWRSMNHVLSTEVVGESLAFPDFTVVGDNTGIGMNDWSSHAVPLAEEFKYHAAHMDL